MDIIMDMIIVVIYTCLPAHKIPAPCAVRCQPAAASEPEAGLRLYELICINIDDHYTFVWILPNI